MLADLPTLIQQCAPGVGPATMAAIIKVESGGNPYAININNGVRLQRTAQSQQEAISWAKWLISNGYNIDMGLTQVNSANMSRLQVSVEQLFEPCSNISAGAQILSANYVDAVKRDGPGQKAFLSAISAYNTGSQTRGFSNGYVARVAGAAGTKVDLKLMPSGGASTPPLIAAKAKGGVRFLSADQRRKAMLEAVASAPMVAYKGEPDN